MDREREVWYSGSMIKVKCFKNWMIDAASVLFDDNHNDLRALPKTVRLQLLVVLSFVWSTVFTVYCKKLCGKRTGLLSEHRP